MLTAEQLQCIIGRDDKEQPQDRKELYLPFEEQKEVAKAFGFMIGGGDIADGLTADPDTPEEKIFFRSVEFAIQWDEDIMEICKEFRKRKGTAA